MKVNIFGVPSCAGALYEGTEQAPNALRQANLVERLKGCGFEVWDHGDLVENKILPRHNVGPVRNWPAPRIVWEALQNKAEDLFSKDDFTILIGGDCSIEVGSFSAFRSVFGQKAHLLVLDGHVDMMKPQGDQCIGAAGMGLWFLLEEHKMWWSEDLIPPSSISVIGAQSIPEDCLGVEVISLEKIQEEDGLMHLKRHLDSLSKDVHIFVHMDVDVFDETVIPAAYYPSKEGMNFDKAIPLLQMILSDPRVRGLEIAEFSAVKDQEGLCAQRIVDMICQLGA